MKNYFSDLEIEKRVAVFQNRLTSNNNDYYNTEAIALQERIGYDFTPIGNGIYETTSSRSIKYTAYSKQDAITLMKGNDPVFWVNVTLDQEGGYPESCMNVCTVKANRKVLVKRHSNPRLGGTMYIQIPLNDDDITNSSKFI